MISGENFEMRFRKKSIVQINFLFSCILEIIITILIAGFIYITRLAYTKTQSQSVESYI